MQWAIGVLSHSEGSTSGAAEVRGATFRGPPTTNTFLVGTFNSVQQVSILPLAKELIVGLLVNLPVVETQGWALMDRSNNPGFGEALLTTPLTLSASRILHHLAAKHPIHRPH